MKEISKIGQGESDISVSEEEESDTDDEESTAESEIESETSRDSWTFDVSPLDIIEFDGLSYCSACRSKGLRLFLSFIS